MTYDTSYGAIQAIYRPLTPTRNETGAFFTYACPFLRMPLIHVPMKSHIRRWNGCWKSKIFQIAHRQMLYITYNISQDAIQAKHRPLTPSTTRDMDI